VREFDAPPSPWAAGHRGIDLAASAGTNVRAAATGEVTFAGSIAGRGVMVIQHGRLRSTYEPVDPIVPPGTRVRAGQPIATVAATGGHCAPAAVCLHWGVRDDDHYVDPLRLLSPRPSAFDTNVVLLPIGKRALTGDPPSRERAESRGSAASLVYPVGAPFITSPYGMRTHPVTGEHKLHDGTDFRAPCGSPIRAAADGMVTRAGPRGAYGLQVAIDHGSDGSVTGTSYSHLSRLALTAGRSVRAGQVIGWSGTTGRSTGCHLHFMVYVGGAVTNPMRYLPHSSR
jgi:murein DD-endopeptidase MepM/ murein hydrolase activator NlpD